MLHKSIFLIFSLVCFLCYFYGVLVTFTSINSEQNECKMTYMFELPNFVRINFEENEHFPKYKLYAYAEGHLTINARNMFFTGAPVLFLPGNSGSHKQSRSLASVALRKGIDNEWFYHLDFFAVDLNEEYSALFGGVLEEQAQFIEHAIRAILKLYERLPHAPQKIVIIGHSIGGKLAQKLLASAETAKMINSIINLASPMDKPILNWDIHINNFYQSIEDFWVANRRISESHLNNSCINCNENRIMSEDSSERKALDDKLLITIGGGSKDLQVHSGLTDSKFSDLHIMSSAMSKVWLESDHLCIVWCLQLVLVINRFLYSIIAPPKYKGTHSKGLSFIDDKALRLAKAEQHFLGLPRLMKEDEKVVRMESPNAAEWYEDNRRIFTEKFKNGINKTRIQMIRLFDSILHRAVRVDVINLEAADWVFGCEAAEVTQESRHCSQAISLSNYSVKVPSDLPDRVTLSLNLLEIKQRNSKWTHVLLKFPPSKEPFQFTVDIHNPSDREVKIAMPKWYSFGSSNILEDTLLGSSHYQLKITGLDETHQVLEIIITPKHCSKHRTLTKICIPWTSGFDRYERMSEFSNSFFVWTPKSRPLNYNTTQNPILVDLMLDSSCRYSITIKQSFTQMVAKIVQQFSHWLPAHLVAVLCLALKHQLSLTPAREKFRCGSLHKALATCTPFFIISVSRLFFKFILMLKILPKPETLPTSLSVSILLHGTALAMIVIFTGALWAGITFWGSIAHKVLFKLVHMPIPMISDTIVSIIEKFPASVAALLLSLTYSSCGGIALIVACVIYFILLSKMYEDYLENFVFKTAKLIAMKLFGRVRKSKTNSDDETEGQTESSSATQENSQSKDEQQMKIAKIDESQTSNDNEEGVDEEIDKMLEEVLSKQREEKLKKDKEDAASRIEYDSLTEGLDEINFHLPLFILLVVITVLSLPSVITWAKNYQYSRILSPDPIKLPATLIITSLGFIWQLNTPRDLIGYKYVGSILYVIAVISVLYCQDAFYRLTFIITGIFVLIAVHQVLAPKQKRFNAGDHIEPDIFDKLKLSYDKFKSAKGFVSK